MIDIIVVTICSVGGFLLGKYMEKRAVSKGDFYKDLVKYVDLFKLNVNGRQVEIDKFNTDFSASCSPAFYKRLVSGELSVNLKPMQKRDIDNFFAGLNCSSSQELLKHLDYYGVIFSDEYSSIFNADVKRATLWSKLGILLGVMAGILLI